jgi:hypothetical protein
VTNPKDSDKKAGTKTSKLPLKKDALKDLTVQPGKEKNVVGGGTPSRPRTGTDFTCNPC